MTGDIIPGWENFFCSALLYDRQATLEKRLGLAIAALGLIELR